MEKDAQNTDTQNPANLPCIERIQLLLNQAENIDQDTIESMPALAQEINELSAAISYENGKTESLLLLARYNAMRDNYIEAIGLADDACQKFTDAGDALGQIKALGTLGFSYGQLGRLDTALRYFLDGLKLYNDNGFTDQVAEAIKGNLLNNLASNLWRFGQV